MKNFLIFKKKIRLGVVLLGGGVRALAHIGFLKSLKENNIKIDLICGTSMGGIIAGLFAYGYEPEKIEEMALNFDYKSLLLVPKTASFFKTKNLYELIFLLSITRLIKKEEEDKVEAILKNLTKEELIENLKTKFFCIAGDLLSGKEVIFDKGPLYKALRATMSYPFVFEPLYYNKMLLIDGGVVDNAPVIMAKKFGAEKVVVVDIHRPIKKEKREKFKNELNILKRIFEMMSEKLVEINLSMADYILRIDINKDTFDFSNISEVINIGKQKSDEKILEIKRVLRK